MNPEPYYQHCIYNKCCSTALPDLSYGGRSGLRDNLCPVWHSSRARVDNKEEPACKCIGTAFFNVSGDLAWPTRLRLRHWPLTLWLTSLLLLYQNLVDSGGHIYNWLLPRSESILGYFVSFFFFLKSGKTLRLKGHFCLELNHRNFSYSFSIVCCFWWLNYRSQNKETLALRITVVLTINTIGCGLCVRACVRVWKLQLSYLRETLLKPNCLCNNSSFIN